NPFGPDGILGGVGAADDDFRLDPLSIAQDAGVNRARDIVLASTESLSTRTTRTDRRLEGQLDDLLASNLGFHYPLPLAPYASLAPGGARLTHSQPGDVQPLTRAWQRELPLATD